MFYDKASKIIWLRIESNVVDSGPIAGISGMIPTEKGFIQVSGYSSRDDFSSFDPVFRNATISLTPANELIYKPKWTESLRVLIGAKWLNTCLRSFCPRL